MSLIAWFPLNNSLANIGASNIGSLNGSHVAWGQGKIGSYCASFDNNTGKILYVNENTADKIYFKQNDNFSYALWLKKTFLTDHANYVFTVGRADSTSYGYAVQVLSTTSIRFKYGNASYDVSNINDDTWYHIAFTKSGNILKIYVNGVLNSTKTFTGTYPTYTEAHGLGLGCFHYNTNGTSIYPFKGSINDFRIYNHALSESEVKEISQGLVGHYRLSNNHTENLLPWNTSYTPVTPYVHTSASTDGYKTLTNSLTTVTPGTVYYISVCCNGNISTHGGTHDPANKDFTIFLYERLINTTKTVGNYDSTTNLNSTNLYKKIGNRYIWKYTCKSNLQDICIRTNSYSNGTTSVSINFWNFCISKDNNHFPCYVPGKNEPTYAKMGYNSLIEEDCSGYANKGTKSKAFTIYANSPMNDGCYNFTGDNTNYIWCNNTLTPNNTEFTISCWVYKENTTNFEIFTCRKAYPNGVMCVIGNTSAIFDDGVRFTTTNYSDIANKWTMFTFVRTTTKKQVYINGILHNETTTLGTLKDFDVKTCIGNNAADSALSSDFAKCKASDLRIYVTALSAADILNLYNKKSI